MSRGGKFVEYEVWFVWVPRLDRLSEEERRSRYSEVLASYEADGWTFTAESREEVELPRHRLEERSVGLKPGWIVRLEVERCVTASPSE